MSRSKNYYTSFLAVGHRRVILLTITLLGLSRSSPYFGESTWGTIEGDLEMNGTIYPTILTGLGIVIRLIVTMHNLAKANQQETNRRIDDLKNDLKELLDAKFKVIDSRFEVVDVRFQRLEGNLADLRHEGQDIRAELRDIKSVIFKPAA